MSNPLQSAFKNYKIILALFIGLSISGYMIYRAFSEVKIIKVEHNSGNLKWVDGNHNNHVDLNDLSDFKKVKTGNYQKQTLRTTLQEVTWSKTAVLWIFVAILFTVGRDLFYMIRIRLLTKKKLTWKSSFFVIMLWEFASALSPGVVGGAAVAMFILNRETIPMGKATAIVIVTAFMDNLFYIVMIPLVFVFLRNTEVFNINGDTSVALTLWFWGGFTIILLVCTFLYVSLFWRPKLAGEVLLLLFSLPFIKRWKFVAREWGKDIEIAAKQFKNESSGFWWKVFGSTVASWLSRYLVINALLQAFISLSVIDHVHVLAKQLILWLFMLVSPTPGGSGIAEYAFGELLSDFTSSAMLLVALAILWLLISYFPYLVIGSILLPVWLRKNR